MGRLDGADRQVRAPWFRGWYPGVVIPEYESEGGDGKVYIFKTEDRTTQTFGLRQVQLCIGLAAGDDIRKFNYSVYYNPESLFNSEHVAAVMAMAKDPANKRGRWADTAMQRDYMSFVSLHEIEKAILGEGKEIPSADTGGLDLSSLVGQKVDCFYSIYHKTEKEGKKITDEVPIDILKKYAAGEEEWQKGWFGGIKYLAPPGSQKYVMNGKK